MQLVFWAKQASVSARWNKKPYFWRVEWAFECRHEWYTAWICCFPPSPNSFQVSTKVSKSFLQTQLPWASNTYSYFRFMRCTITEYSIGTYWSTDCLNTSGQAQTEGGSYSNNKSAGFEGCKFVGLLGSEVFEQKLVSDWAMNKAKGKR